jgi:hypothetical protein
VRKLIDEMVLKKDSSFSVDAAAAAVDVAADDDDDDDSGDVE